jgi:hypothetical protein
MRYWVLDPGDGGDGGVGTSSVPPTVYSHSVGIGMPTAMKTKINNMQTIELEPSIKYQIKRTLHKYTTKLLNYYPLNPLIKTS